MKLKFNLVVILTLILMVGCSSDDDDKLIDPPKKNIELVGKWMIKEINFTSNVKEWKSETITNTMDIFGWAPYMYGGVSGIEFTDQDYTDSQTQKKGKMFNLVTGTSHGGSNKVFWIWNYTEDGKGFEMIQLNSQMPPYDFSMSKTSSLQETTIDGKRALIFSTTLKSLDQNKMSESSNPMTRPKVAANATFILVKASGEIDTEASPSLKLKGLELKLPKQGDPSIVTKENLKGTAWMLKSGSKIYDPGFSAQNPALEFAKLITLYFESDKVLKFRYSFPMGIISTKVTTWEYNDETHIVSYVKSEGAMESTTMKFVWKASYLTEGDKKSLLLELQEVINNFGKETAKELDLSTVDTDILKREFVAISGADTENNEIVLKDNYVIFK